MIYAPSDNIWGHTLPKCSKQSNVTFNHFYEKQTSVSAIWGLSLYQINELYQKNMHMLSTFLHWIERAIADHVDLQ